MATDSDTKLTRHLTGVTVVTAELANSLYGGEYGYNSSVDRWHPSVHGHLHDGDHEDGHASKINLTSGLHVRGYLGHGNLSGSDEESTPAVQVNNIQCYSEDDVNAAIAAGEDNPCIPEYSVDPISGDKCYYLDLSMTIGGSDTHVQYNEDGVFGGDDGFVYDYSTGRVGIGTANPTTILEINSDDASGTEVRIAQHNGESADGPNIILVNANGTYASPSATADSDYIGSLNYQGYDSSDYASGAAVQARAAKTWSPGDTPAYLLFRTTSDGSTSLTEKVRITSEGLVGIGTDDPQSLLDIAGSVAVGASYAGTSAAPTDGLIVEGNVGIGLESPSFPLEISTSDSGLTNDIGLKVANTANHCNILIDGHTGYDSNVFFGESGTVKWSIGNDEDNEYFRVRDSSWDTRFLIKQDGKVGIGTNEPQSKLDIEGGVTIGSSYSGTSAAPTDGLIVEGSVGIGTTSPDALLHVSSDDQYGGVVRVSQFDSSTDGPNVVFLKSGGEESAPTIVGSSDYIGSLSFRAYDGDSEEQWAWFGSQVDGTPSDTSHPANLEFWTTEDGSTSLTQRMTISGDGNVGINEVSPQRILHVTDNGADPPVRIESLSAGTGTVVVVDGSGDLYIDSTITSNNIFSEIAVTSTGGGSASGANCVAGATADTLTLDAGDGIKLTAAPLVDTVEIALSADLSELNNVSTTPPAGGQVLEYNGSTGEWEPGTASASGSSLATQWIDATGWAGESGAAPKTLIMVGPGRTVACRVMQDNTGADNCILHASVPIPLSQSVGGGAAGPMFGAQDAPPPPWAAGYDPVSIFPAAAPTSCRITLYFIMDMSGQVDDLIFETSLWHNSVSAASPTPMFEFPDGVGVTDNLWNNDHTAGLRVNNHTYDYATGTPMPIGYYYAVSDFSPWQIDLNAASCGIYQFKTITSILSAPGGFAIGDIYFVGSRLQWIW